MNSLLSTLLVLSVAVYFASAMDISSSTSNELKSDVQYSTETITTTDGKKVVNVVNEICTVTGYIKKAVNNDCTEYNYYKQTVTSSSSPSTDVNNGIAKCTQKKCDSSDEPSTVDCLEAFGKVGLSSLENKQ
ncbi:unnamed protein product [Caenorhabditis brenneri]